MKAVGDVFLVGIGAFEVDSVGLVTGKASGPQKPET